MDATFDHYINYTNVPSTSPTADPCDPSSLGNPGGQGHVPIWNALLENQAVVACVRMLRTFKRHAEELTAVLNLLMRHSNETAELVAGINSFLDEHDSESSDASDEIFSNTKLCPDIGITVTRGWAEPAGGASGVRTC